MAQNSIWILKGQTGNQLLELAEQEDQKLECGGSLQFLSDRNAKTTKNKHSKEKKKKSSRLIRRHVRSKQRRNGKKIKD